MAGAVVRANCICSLCHAMPNNNNKSIKYTKPAAGQVSLSIRCVPLFSGHKTGPGKSFVRMCAKFMNIYFLAPLSNALTLQGLQDRVLSSMPHRIDINVFDIFFVSKAHTHRSKFPIWFFHRFAYDMGYHSKRKLKRVFMFPPWMLTINPTGEWQRPRAHEMCFHSIPKSPIDARLMNTMYPQCTKDDEINLLYIFSILLDDVYLVSAPPPTANATPKLYSFSQTQRDVPWPFINSTQHKM